MARLESDHERRGLARHLRHQPGAAPVGCDTTVDPLAPQIGCEVRLEHLVGDGDAGAQGDLRHPGELVVQVPHVAGHGEDPVSRLAQRLADGDELVRRCRGARRQLAVLGPVQDRAGGRRPHRPGADRLAHERAHLRDLLCSCHVVGPALTQDVGAQRAVRDEARDVEDAWGPLDLVQVLAEGFPIPVDALGQGGARDVLDALHEPDQPLAVGGSCGREPDPAVSGDHRGHTVPTRGGDLGVPGHLAVVVGVDVHPPRRDEQSAGVHDAASPPIDVPDGGDDAALQGDVGLAERPAGAIGNRSPLDDQVVHAAQHCSSVRRIARCARSG